MAPASRVLGRKSSASNNNAPQDRIATLARELFQLKKQKDDLKRKATEVEKRINQIATHDLAKLMLDSEVEKQTITGFGTVYMSDVFYCNVLVDDQPVLLDWLKQNGHGDIIKETVHHGTLKAFAQEMATKGEALPEVVKVAYVPTAKTHTAT